MKKYISFLILTAAITLQSCDRSELSFDSEDQIQTRQETSAKNTNETFARSGDNIEAQNSNNNKTETGDDKEPRKDKSHWRIPNDTVR
ncbi:hypothetical protein LPB85_12820 [Chryseobacterium sp. LC2016-27]|uniref:hypothetical protein n=1 Tax=Chryseobacterium sp. LC2016-27 TaxID=2897326 RepID=UPI001E41C62B|nr:hypothetical protein [Chryseobacterium sp. LC2016-27]MCD0456320.1 hypothetical protein [Chryseobacterium sp. LC2016-27]